jgi:hypothetical protein
MIELENHYLAVTTLIINSGMNYWTEDVGQLVEHLPRKCKSLN